MNDIQRCILTAQILSECEALDEAGARGNIFLVLRQMIRILVLKARMHRMLKPKEER